MRWPGNKRLFRQRLTSEDGPREIPDKAQLGLLPFLPPDAEDKKMLAARSELLEKLLRAPRNPNVASEDGVTPLHFAAIFGDVGAMWLLLEARAQEDARPSSP